MTSCPALDFRESHWVTKCAAAAEKHPKASLNPPKARDEAQDLNLGRFLEVLRTNDYRFEKNKESSFSPQAERISRNLVAKAWPLMAA